MERLGIVVYGLLQHISPQITGVERGGPEATAGLYWYCCKQFNFISLHKTAKAQASRTFKQPTPGRGEGDNPVRLTPCPDKSLKDKEQKHKEKRDELEKDKARPNKKSEPEG
jgi:hypothetical protein